MEVKPGYRQTEVGVSPEDWVDQSLQTVGRWFSGSTPSMASVAYWSGDIPWVSPKDMKVTRISDSEDHISPRAVADGTRVLPSGAILIVIRGMILAHSLPVARTERGVAFNQDIKAVVTGSDVDSQFLLYWLIANAHHLRSLTTESTHGTKRLPTEMLFRALVACPPLAEQEAIAEALSDADALIESLEHLLIKKRQLKQGAMQELLTGKKRLPGFGGEWEVTRLGDLGGFLTGSGVNRDESSSGGLACVRYGELYTRHNDYIRTFHSWISPNVAATATRLKRGDILFAGSGETKEEIGKCVAFVDDVEAYAGGDIVILRTERGDPLFLGYYLNTLPINQQKASRGQGDAVVHISAAALSEIRGAFPPVAEQTAIAGVLSDMDAEIAALEVRLAKAHQLKQGMMHELLAGKIRLV